VDEETTDAFETELVETNELDEVFEELITDETGVEGRDDNVKEESALQLPKRF
jgi:hypothetical protein